MASDLNEIKIGLTGGVVEKRRRGLSTGHSGVLRVLHTLPGGRREEEALHERFRASKKPRKREWFFRTADVEQWLDTLERQSERQADETALEWLARLGTADALHASEEWRRLRAFVIGRLGRWPGGWTLWDILAGRAEKGRYEPLFRHTVIRCREQRFRFPAFAEAAERQGIAIPEGAIVTGVRPRSHRSPQLRRWGNRALRGYERSAGRSHEATVTQPAVDALPADPRQEPLFPRAGGGNP